MRLFLAAVLALAAGCTCVDDPTGHDFACDPSHPCAEGWVCDAGHCQNQGAGGGGGTGSEDCTNGIDDDGDSLADCADPKCLHHICSSTLPDHVCCSQSAATGCVKLDGKDNCGGCGIVCPSGTCDSTVLSGFYGGTCSCTGGAACPKAGDDAGLLVDQVCDPNNDECVCNANAGCGPGATCGQAAGNFHACQY